MKPHKHIQAALKILDDYYASDNADLPRWYATCKQLREQYDLDNEDIKELLDTYYS